MKLPQVAYAESNADYHADMEFIGNSMVTCSAESLTAYHAYFIAKSRPKPPPTKAKRLGSVLHAMLFEGGKGYVQASDDVNPRKKAWAAAVKAALPDVLVSQEEWTLALGMFNAVRLHEDFQALVSGQVAKGEVLIGDVKSAQDPTPGAFAGVDEPGSRQRWGVIHYLGYHRQAAHYTEGVHAALPHIPAGVYRECSIRWQDEVSGLKLKCRPDIMAVGAGEIVHVNWLWLAVGNTWPHDVYPYRLLPDLLQDAQLENGILRDRLARSYETGDWFAAEQYTAVEVGSPRRNSGPAMYEEMY